MNIGLDWDGTVTNDLNAFLAIASILRNNGHKVYVVTMRYPSELGSIRQFASHFDGIFPTSRQAKKPHMEKHGINIHVWIDDNPEAVSKSASEIWENVSEEGTVIDVQHDKPDQFQVSHKQ